MLNLLISNLSIMSQTNKLIDNRKIILRGKQKIPPSGHLAPTIEFKNGKVYPSVINVDIAERQARKFDHPENYPHWFSWFYQWADKDPNTNLWRTHSIRVPTHLIHSIRHMINTHKSVSEILFFVRKNKHSLFQ